LGAFLDLTPALDRVWIAGLALDVKLISVAANELVELVDELLLLEGVPAPPTAGAGCCIIAPAAAPNNIGEYTFQSPDAICSGALMGSCIVGGPAACIVGPCWALITRLQISFIFSRTKT
jgi:hypothetical protein